MAIIKSSLFVLSGNIGNYILKRRGKTEYISLKPVSYTTSQTPAAVQNRNKFASLTIFSTFVNKSHRLKQIWLNSDLEGSSPYHKLMKANASNLKDGLLTPLNQIAPRTFENPVNEIALTLENITITLNTEIIPRPQSDYTLDVILSYIRPKAPEKPPVVSFQLFSNVSPDSPILTFSLFPFIKETFPLYEEVIVFTCLSKSMENQISWFSRNGEKFTISDLT
ncbi:MAG: hypothetical protein AB9882_15670 [Ignavibacteriaceae bacterium]